MIEEVRVEQVSVELVRRLRGAVLRPGLPPKASIYPSDSSPEAQHFAAWFDNKIIGVASIHPEILPKISRELLDKDFLGLENAWRLRGMAVDPNFQGKGIGKQILQECLKFIEQFNAAVLWCNGRATAWEFYRSLGFKIIGEQFDVPESGAHFVMMLQIKNLN